MNSPYIALSGSVDDKGVVSINKNYLSAIWDAGGIPVLLTPRCNEEYMRKISENFDGFVFCGGEDIDPKYYGEERSNKTRNICSLRDEFEEKLFWAVYTRSKPILGICRGMQVINVFLGGTLHQHVDEHIQTEARNVLTHTVSVKKGSLLETITGKGELYINSFHHQAIKSLSAELMVDAVSTNDGFIEAFHHKEQKFLLGIQWHPESYYVQNDSARRIFGAFIGASKRQSSIK